ncbi:alpha/beta hydrolase [Halolamina sp. CBA1230]|uniref:alpha/beta fold hydrolase n=1 Tax=Halolamina sp. CBA1230 TaxID=1853690 RepID=UPI0009A184FE|nr:alpha/beta hydrolase [Halolamina sp. CBA1230]QKY21129.1 alpha/beta hydrolase [Halolamina sp. CBA1230]
MTTPSTTQWSTFSTVEDRQVAFTEYGDPDGVPVLFLHGTPGSRQLGELFHADARDLGVRLIAPDRPGYGRSDPWPERSIADAGTYLTDLLDDAGVETAGVIGFSGGGAHALALAATHPDRVGAVDVVAGVTPPSTREKTPTPQRVLSALASATPTLLGGLFRGQAWLAERLDPSFVLTQYTDDPESIPERAGTVVKEEFLEAFAESRSGTVTEFRNTAAAWGVPFDALDADVRFRHGGNDTNVPIASARRLYERIPSAEFHALDDADHLQTLLRAAPDALAAQADES